MLRNIKILISPLSSPGVPKLLLIRDHFYRILVSREFLLVDHYWSTDHWLGTDALANEIISIY